MDSTLEPEEPIISPPWGEFGRVFTLAVVSLTGKFVLNWWNTTKIANQSTLLELLQQRDKGVGLITVSNHTRYTDSPDSQWLFAACRFSRWQHSSLVNSFHHDERSCAAVQHNR